TPGRPQIVSRPAPGSVPARRLPPPPHERPGATPLPVGGPHRSRRPLPQTPAARQRGRSTLAKTRLSRDGVTTAFLWFEGVYPGLRGLAPFVALEAEEGTTLAMEIKSRPGSVVAAMIGAAAVTAQLVSGTAVRDALFLTSLDLSALPELLVATSVCSILLVVTNARAARTIGPATLVPASFAVSGVLFLIEWVLRPQAPSSTAIVVYLHISG